MILPRLLDWIYPPRCTLCETPLNNGRHLCQTCSHQLPRLNNNRCLTCAHQLEGPVGLQPQCPNCQTLKPAFDFANASLLGTAHVIDLIHRFKLQGQVELARDLAPFLVDTFRSDSRFTQLANPLLIPVPLHPRRQRERKYNQAHELTRFTAKLLDINSQNLLRRTAFKPRQATLTRKQRLQNLHNAFTPKSPKTNLKNRDLILIDDVLTTGSTLHECARALRSGKPRTIAVLTVVRA
ncbi:MAG: ComF family protein [Verrucomicrobiota bacterium]